MPQIQLQSTRKTIIDGRHVDGWNYLQGNGKSAWYIKTWPVERDPIDDYWVEGKEFFEMISMNSSGTTIPVSSIEIGRPISEMDAAKKAAVLKAIAEWETDSVAE